MEDNHLKNNDHHHASSATSVNAELAQEPMPSPLPVFPENNNNKEETKMADVDTYTLAGQHSDIRREAVEHTSEVIKEGIKGDYATQAAINGVERAQSNQIDALEDVMNNQFFTVARDTQDIRAQVISAQQAMVSGFLGAAKDSEINALKTQVELAKQTTYLSDKIDAGNATTQALINGLRDSDQTRMLIERNAELVGALADGRHWRHGWEQGNWQSVNNRLNALDSQFAETRQGMVNFGTMAGVGQTSTSNNVK